MGGGIVPNKLSDEQKKEWRTLRGGGLTNILKPDELTHYFEKWGYLSEQVKELLEDYRYYIEFRKHRRPEVWRKRHDWLPLTD